MDGTVDAASRAPIVVQTVETRFVDAMPPGALNGSELDAAYARVEESRLLGGTGAANARRYVAICFHYVLQSKRPMRWLGPTTSTSRLLARSIFHWAR